VVAPVGAERTTDWPALVLATTTEALRPCADPDRAEQMAAYMRHVAPFLGVQAPERRRVLRRAWAGMPTPVSAQLGAGARLLALQAEREFHYAAYDLVGRYLAAADDGFLGSHVEWLLTTTPWWDTVDGLVTAAVSPLARRHGAAAVVDRWSRSGDVWLIRAAIQHQRGWKQDTDVTQVLELCDRHWGSGEFFVAKAIGWALRDLTRVDPAAVRRFLAGHPAPDPVATREAQRGLARLRPETGR
jgi:3-methyladenine DNA glycosylase AlkD